eukprot:4906122-Pleurochrysis_carterae.AAC.2
MWGPTLYTNALSVVPMSVIGLATNEHAKIAATECAPCTFRRFEEAGGLRDGDFLHVLPNWFDGRAATHVELCLLHIFDETQGLRVGVYFARRFGSTRLESRKRVHSN